MAVKTITIDLEAYHFLARQKREGQSFSEVIKERFGRQKTISGLLAAAPALLLEETTLETIETIIKDRKRNRARVPKL